MDTKKTRSSIRKTLNKDEEHTQETPRPARRISFSGKLSVRLFCKEEKTQNWDKSFEVSDHTSGDSTENSAGCIVAASTAGSVTGIYHDNANADKENPNSLNSLSNDNIDGSHYRNSLHIENSVDVTLLPHEIINAKKQQHLDSVMSITPLNGSDNLTFITDVERAELRTAKKSQQVFDKTVDFMIDLNRAPEINREKAHHTNYTMSNMDESMDQQILKGNNTNYIMSNMEESLDQQTLNDLHERCKSIRQVQAMDITTYGKENIPPINLTEFCIEEPNKIISKDLMKDNREVVCMETDKTIQNVPPPQKTIIFNDDDIIIDSDPVTQQSQYSESTRKRDKPKVIIRTIQAVSTTSTRADLEQKRLQRYHQKQQEQESQIAQPTDNQIIRQHNQEKSSINNQSLNCSARSSLSLESTLYSPLIPPDCISGNCNKRKLNLRQLNDDIEHGRIQIFPNGPKTPTTDRKTKQRERNWYMNDDSLNKSEVDMEMSYMVTNNLKSSKKTEVTSYEVEKMSYRYSQADEANLDKTNFLTKVQIGDDDPRTTTYSPNILDMEETINDDDDLLEGFKTDMETQNINNYPTSRKSLFFENMDMEATCVDNPVQDKEQQESIVLINIEANSKLDRITKLSKEASSDILDSTPELNTLQQLRYRQTIQFTPGRSMIEFEDLEQECENVTDENGKNTKQQHVSSPSKDINESFSTYMSCEEEDQPDSDPVQQHEVPRRKRESIYKAVDIVLESSPSNKNMKPKIQTNLPDPFSKSRQLTYNAVSNVQEESLISCEVNRDLGKNKGFPCETDGVVPMDFEGETHGNGGGNKNRKSIYKPVDIDLDTTCIGNKYKEQSGGVLQEALYKPRQTTYNSVPIIPESTTFVTNNQSDDVVSNSQSKYRKSIYKTIDIDLETTCVGNKDEEQSAELQRKTTLVRKNIDFNIQTDVVPMESEVETQGNDNYMIRNNKYRKSNYKTVDIDLETSCVGNKEVEENAVLPAKALCNQRQSTYNSVPIIPESTTFVTMNQSDDGVPMNSQGETHHKQYSQSKYRKSIYKPVDIDLETTCIGNKDEEQSAELQRKTTLVRKNIDFNIQTDVVPMESEGETQGNDNYMIRNNKYRKSIYKTVDIDLETSCIGNKEVEENAVLPAEALCNQRQSTYNSVPIIPESTTFVTKNQSDDGVPMNSQGETHHKQYSQSKYRKSIYKPVDIDLETTCIGNKDEEQSAMLQRKTTLVRKNIDFNIQTDVVPMESEGETQGTDNYMMRNNKYRKSINKTVDIDLETSCIGNKEVEENAVLPTEALCNQRQSTYNSVTIVPEAPKFTTKNSDFNNQSDEIPMDFEEEKQKVDKSNTKRKYRESTYKPIDIVTETPTSTKDKKVAMSEFMLVEASRKSRQTPYNSEPILVENPSSFVSEDQQKQTKTCYAYETDDMRIDGDGDDPADRYSIQNDIPKTQRKYQETSFKPIEHNAMFLADTFNVKQTTYHAVSIVPESLPSEMSRIERDTSKHDKIVVPKECESNMGQQQQQQQQHKFRQSIYRPIDIDVEMPNIAGIENNSEISRKSRQTIYNSVPIVPESPQIEMIESVNRNAYDDLERDGYENDNNKLIEQRKDRQSIYMPSDIVLETTTSSDGNEGVKDNVKIPRKSSGKSRQSTYQSVPIDLDITEFANKKADISLEAFDEPMDFEEYPTAAVPVDNHNLVQHDKSNMQRRYRKSTYKPVDINIEDNDDDDDDDDNIMTEVKVYSRQIICNSNRREEELNRKSIINSKNTTTNRRQSCYTPFDIEQDQSSPENTKPQLLMKPSNIRKEFCTRNISVKGEVEEGDDMIHKYDFDRLEMDHKELLGSYECGKVAKIEIKNQTSNDEHYLSPSHNNIEKSTTKRLPIHLTPHLPSSKKRHTICKDNKDSMNRESLAVVGGEDTTQYNLLQKIDSIVNNSCLDNESIPQSNYLTPARKKSHASRIPLLNSAKKSPFCRAPSILEHSVQAPRCIQQQSRNTLEVENVNDIDKSQEATNKPQGAVSIFEGNPITISDVSRHFEAQKRLTAASLPDSSEQSSSNSSMEQHNNRYKSRDKGKTKSLMKFINWSSDTTLFAAGNDVPTIDLLENTRISLVETLINDDGTNNEEEELQFSPESKTDSIIENVEVEEEQQDGEKDIKIPIQSLQCSNSIDPVDYAEDSFDLPQLPYWPKKAMERLRQIRGKPHIADVHEYWRRKSMEQSCVIINDSIDGEELIEEFCAANIIANYQKTRKMHRLNRQQLLKKPVRLPFAKRLDKLLHENCPIWIFDYELEGRNQYLFSHKKILTMSLIMNFEELDILGNDIVIKSVNYECNRIPKKNWEPFDYLIDFQIKLKMSLMHQQTLLQECDENVILKFLCNIDNILMDVRRTCDDLWNIVCMKQSQLIRNANRTIVRKVVRTVVSKPNGYSRVEAKEFFIEITNIEKLSFKDILLPKLYFFREDIQYLPIGLNFLRQFLSNPMKYLKK